MNDNCLEEMTLVPVYMKSGKKYMSIGDIYKRYKRHTDTYLYTTTGVKKILEVKDLGFKDVAKLVLSNRKDILCSFSNKFLLYVDNQQVSTSYLRIGDELLEVNSSDTIKVTSVIPLGMRKSYSIQLENSDNYALKAGIYSAA